MENRNHNNKTNSNTSRKHNSIFYSQQGQSNSQSRYKCYNDFSSIYALNLNLQQNINPQRWCQLCGQAISGQTTQAIRQHMEQFHYQQLDQNKHIQDYLYAKSTIQENDEYFLKMIQTKQKKRSRSRKYDKGAIKLRKKRSRAWQFFEQINLDTAVCQLCSKHIELFAGTTYLFRHLKQYHGFTKQWNQNRIQNKPKKSNKKNHQKQVNSNRNNNKQQPKVFRKNNNHLSQQKAEKISYVRNIHQLNQQSLFEKNENSVKYRQRQHIFVGGSKQNPKDIKLEESIDKFGRQQLITYFEFNLRSEQQNYNNQAIMGLNIHRLQDLIDNEDPICLVFVKSYNLNYILVCYSDFHLNPIISGIIYFQDQTLEYLETLIYQFYQKLSDFQKQKSQYLSFITLLAPPQILQCMSNALPFLTYAQINIIKDNDIEIQNKLKKKIFNQIIMNQTQKSSNIIYFRGLCLTYNYVEKLRIIALDLCNNRLDIQGQIEHILLQNRQFEGNAVLQQKIEGLQCFGLVPQTLLNSMKQNFSEQIYLRILAIYVHAVLNINLQEKQANMIQARNILYSNIWQTSQKSHILFYNDEIMKWECSCKLESIVGILCPHLLKLIIQNQLNIYQYISKRWFMNGISKQCLQNANKNNRDINKERSMQKIKQLNWISFDEKHYLQLFWS